MSQFLFQRLRDVVSPGTQVVYYRCSGGEEDRNTATAMLRAVLWQLARSVSESGQTEAKDCLRRRFEQQRKHAQAKGQDYLANQDYLWNIIFTMASEPVIGPIYVVLDGLDKLDKESVSWLMRQYKSVADGTHAAANLALKIIVVSEVVAELQELAKEPKYMCAVVDLAENKAHVLSDLENVVSEKLRAIDCTPKIEGEVEQRMLLALLEHQSGHSNCSQVYENHLSRKLKTRSFSSSVSRKSLLNSPLHRK